MLPNFIIAGAEKCGTSALHRVLGLHPQIFTTPLKEVYFFRDPNYSKGLDWYKNHFRDWAGEAAVGESSPRYIESRLIAERISTTLPDLRLILILRNPVDRAYSEYWYFRLRLRENLSFDQAVAENKYLQRGFYISQIATYLEYFSRDQLLILLNEDLKSDGKGVYRTCFKFLGVDESVQYPQMAQAYNQASALSNPIYRLIVNHPSLLPLAPPRTGIRRFLQLGSRKPFKYPQMSLDTRKKLVDIFRESNDQLAELVDRDLSCWNF